MFKNHSQNANIGDNCLADYLAPSISHHPDFQQSSQSSRDLDSQLTLSEHSLDNYEEDQMESSSVIESKMQNTISKDIESINMNEEFRSRKKLETSEDNRALHPCASNSSIPSINYRKLLTREIQKCKKLESVLAKQNSKCENLYQLVERLKEENRCLDRMLNKEKTNSDKKNMKIKEIDSKIASIKSQYKASNQKQEILEREVRRGRKERRNLREENEKYRLFIDALMESMGILNSKKVQTLPKLWNEWKQIFEEVSLARCLSKAKK